MRRGRARRVLRRPVPTGRAPRGLSGLVPSPIPSWLRLLPVSGHLPPHSRVMSNTSIERRVSISDFLLF